MKSEGVIMMWLRCFVESDGAYDQASGIRMMIVSESNRIIDGKGVFARHKQRR